MKTEKISRIKLVNLVRTKKISYGEYLKRIKNLNL
jgi:hypothetical protein